jgi:hypothetical protein
VVSSYLLTRMQSYRGAARVREIVETVELTCGVSSTQVSDVLAVLHENGFARWTHGRGVRRALQTTSTPKRGAVLRTPRPGLSLLPYDKPVELVQGLHSWDADDPVGLCADELSPRCCEVLA